MGRKKWVPRSPTLLRLSWRQSKISSKVSSRARLSPCQLRDKFRNCYERLLAHKTFVRCTLTPHDISAS